MRRNNKRSKKMDSSDPIIPRQAVLTPADVEAYRAQIVRECQERIAAVLQEYGCALKAIPYVSDDGRLQAMVQLSAK